MKVLFGFLIIWLGTFSVFAAPMDEEAFNEANIHYHSGDYRQAIQLYTDLIKKNPESSLLYYNLGNSFFRRGSLSEAIFAYEKALKRAPRDLDIRHNLDYAREGLEYRVEDTRNWYLKITEEFLGYGTQKEINFTVLLVGFIFLLSGVLHLILKREVFWSGGKKLLFLILILSALFAAGKYVQNQWIRDAIVMSRETEVRYGPSAHDRIAFRLGEGLKVFVLDHREGWSRIFVVNGESGWVKNSDIAEVIG